MYARDYRLLKLLKELENGFNFTMPHPTSVPPSTDISVDGFNLFPNTTGPSTTANYQNLFKNIFKNPLEEYKNNNSLSKEDKYNVLSNNKSKMESEIKKLNKEIKDLQHKEENHTNIQDLLQATAPSYATNVAENISAIKTDIAKKETDIKQRQTDIQKIESVSTDVPSVSSSNEIYTENDLFKQIVKHSKLYQDYNGDNINKLNTKPFLKILDKISNDPNYYNNTFFLHHIVSQAICQFIKKFQTILKQDYIKSSEMVTMQQQLNKIIDLMKYSMYKKIHFKNNNNKKIEENKEIRDQFYRLCFTIDIVVGNVFMKVLKRLLMTFLKSRYPVSGEKEDVYLQFIRQKVDKMLIKVEKYIQPNYNNNNDDYKPSELTEKLVAIYGKYKLEEEFSNNNEVELFDYILNAIVNNGFEEISDSEPLITHFNKIFLPYFISYYRICINKLINVINNYENFVLNQYYNLNILKLLLDKLIPDDINENRIKQNIQNK